MTSDAAAPEMMENQVADWLQANPGFLAEHPELLEELEAEAPSDGTAFIATYQARSLRKTNAKLQQQLQELVRVASENEALIGRLHQFALGLLSARCPTELIEAIETSMGNEFAVPHARMFMKPKLHLEDVSGVPIIAASDQSVTVLRSFRDVMDRGEPICGRIGGDKLKQLFPEASTPLKSGALIPLGETGLLALGAPDDSKFQPGMETDFLRLLSNMIMAALGRYLESDTPTESRTAL